MPLTGNLKEDRHTFPAPRCPRHLSRRGKTCMADMALEAVCGRHGDVVVAMACRDRCAEQRL